MKFLINLKMGIFKDFHVDNPISITIKISFYN
jgi:hypothetical protein